MRSNNNYTIIEGKLAECYKNAFIMKSVKFNRKKHYYYKWMTPAILKSVNYKNKLYKAMILSKNNPLLYTK